MAHRSDLGWPERINEVGVRSLITLVFGVVGLLLLLVFAAIVPGADQELPAVPMTMGDTVTAAVSLGLVLLIVRIATKSRRIIELLGNEISKVSRPLAAVTHWSIIYFAVIIAHAGFRDSIVAMAFQDELMWAYDLAFFLVGVGTLVLIGYHLLRLLDPLAELFVNKFSSMSSSDRSTIQTQLPIEQGIDREGKRRN